MKYLGHLPADDPFHAYLRYDILPLLGAGANPPDFRVYQFRASNHVYLYEDEHSDIRVIGKFFGGVPDLGSEAALRHMEREFNNLNYLRSIGFNGYPHYVARPLDRNASLNKVVVEEYCHGTPSSTSSSRRSVKTPGMFFFGNSPPLPIFSLRCTTAQQTTAKWTSIKSVNILTAD